MVVDLRWLAHGGSAPFARIEWLLNPVILLETDTDRRAFLFVDSVVVSMEEFLQDKFSTVEQHMRQSITSTVEQRRDFTDSFDTHPMEGAWAGEAIFFLPIDNHQGTAPLVQARVPISPEGGNWVDEESDCSPLRENGCTFERGWVEGCGVKGG